MMNKKAEADLAENLFYVLVCLPQEAPPVFYIVPRRDVAKYIRDDHRTWLETPGRGGRQHVDTDMRRFRDPTGLYRDRWELLGLD
jgi:hypothetical protein